MGTVALSREQRPRTGNRSRRGMCHGPCEDYSLHDLQAWHQGQVRDLCQPLIHTLLQKKLGSHDQCTQGEDERLEVYIQRRWHLRSKGKTVTNTEECKGYCSQEPIKESTRKSLSEQSQLQGHGDTQTATATFHSCPWDYVSNCKRDSEERQTHGTYKHTK